MPVSITLIRKLEGIEPRLREVLFAILEEMEQQMVEAITKKEFNGNISDFRIMYQNTILKDLIQFYFYPFKD